MNKLFQTLLKFYKHKHKKKELRHLKMITSSY